MYYSRYKDKSGKMNAGITYYLNQKTPTGKKEKAVTLVFDNEDRVHITIEPESGFVVFYGHGKEHANTAKLIVDDRIDFQVFNKKTKKFYLFLHIEDCSENVLDEYFRNIDADTKIGDDVLGK